METLLLEQLGFTHNEAVTYITLSRIGSSRTSRLLNESGLNSGKIYETLESLKRKGMVSETIVNGVKSFAAAPPDRLIEYIQKKKEAIDKEADVARRLITRIGEIQKTTIETSRVVVYTGFDGYKSAVIEATNSLKPREEVLAMGVRSSKGKEFNRFWTKWAETTLPKNHERVIFSEKGDFYEFKKSSRFSRIRLLESTTPSAIVIFGNHTVLILQYDPPVKVIFINDVLTVMTFISIFEQLWGVAKDWRDADSIRSSRAI